MVVEFILGNKLGWDVVGLTQSQQQSMNSYEQLLIELGEKSYVPKGEQWCVEIRLAGLILINTAFFLITKMITKKMGSSFGGILNNFGKTSNAGGGTQAGKKRMRGPDIDISDLPEVET